MYKFTPFQQTLFYNIVYDQLSEELQTNPYVQKIARRMTEIIVADFTIGMSDRDKYPYSSTRISHNLASIKKYPYAIERMYHEYKKDGDLDKISTAPDDWFREYLSLSYRSQY